MQMIEIEKKNKQNFKIKHLIKIWPRGTVATTSWLVDNGFSNSNIQQYKKLKWIESLNGKKSGAYKWYDDNKKYEDDISIDGYVWGLQKQYPKHNNFYITGVAALNRLYVLNAIKHKEHFIELGINVNQTIPIWFTNQTIFTFKKTFNIFTESLNQTILYSFGNASIIIANQERALFEALVPDNTFEYRMGLMEYAHNMNPIIFQHLLEECTHVKTKRLFLFLANKLNFSWFDQLNIKNIYLGSGPLQIYKKGKLDKKYFITYPEYLFDPFQF